MTGLPKSIIKKYGISKKAWSVYRGRKTATRTKRKRASTRTAPKRTRRVRTMARRKTYSRRKSSSIFSGSMAPIIGGIGYAAIGEPLLDKLASSLNLGVGDDIVKGIIGYFVMKKTTGIPRELGKAALYVNAYKVGQSKIGKLF